MTDTKKAAERVLELDVAATKGPWRSPWESKDACMCREDDCLCNSFTGADGSRVVGVEYYDGPLIAVKKPDASLIAEYRTLAPQLAREVLAQREVIEEARAMRVFLGCAHGSSVTWRGCSCPSCTAARAFDAAMERMGRTA